MYMQADTQLHKIKINASFLKSALNLRKVVHIFFSKFVDRLSHCQHFMMNSKTLPKSILLFKIKFGIILCVALRHWDLRILTDRLQLSSHEHKTVLITLENVMNML